MIGPILSGQAPARSPAWRPLLFSGSLDSSWQNNASPRVSASAQDAEGWITLALQNKAPAADYPAACAYRRWLLRDSSGLPYDLSDAPTGWTLALALERDTSGWPGSTAQATVGLGLVDRSGDPTHVSAAGLMVGIRTPAAASTFTMICGSMTTAAFRTTVSGTVVWGTMIGTPTQIGFAACASLSGTTATDGSSAALPGAGTTTGQRQIVLTVGCNSTSDNGPHAVRFRAWFSLISASGVPWAS